jgi:hypothetical protein
MSEELEKTEVKGGAHTSSLDIDEDAIRALSERASAMVADYFANVSRLPVFPDKAAIGRLEGLITAGLQDEGEALERIFDDFRLVLGASRHNGHPRFFGYIASPSTPVGAYADLLASALNQNVTSWRSAPAATEVERAVVRWLSELVGYATDASGLLTSGGSLANLTALLIAHRTRAPRLACGRCADDGLRVRAGSSLNPEGRGRAGAGARARPAGRNGRGVPSGREKLTRKD